MNKKRERDEHLEQLWYMKEDARNSVDVLRNAMNDNFEANIIEELISEDMVELVEEDDRINLTEKGESYARGLIRAHRLAERLLYDVLGGDFESGACEFEHTVTPELVDSICILLGHPKACPHGMPIPEGQCCENSSRIAQSSVIPMVELEVGRSARVAYINCKSDQQLHKMDSLCIRPGVVVTLHQRYPSYVVECEGSNIAMDERIVANICVWRGLDHLSSPGKETLTQQRGKLMGWGRFKTQKSR